MPAAYPMRIFLALLVIPRFPPRFSFFFFFFLLSFFSLLSQLVSPPTFLKSHSSHSSTSHFPPFSHSLISLLNFSSLLFLPFISLSFRGANILKELD